MPEFLQLTAPAEALERFLSNFPATNYQMAQTISTADALGRVLAEDVRAPHPLPPFARTTVDGYAVRAADTYGASMSLPAYLVLIGEVHMGTSTDLSIMPGQAALVHTGSMIPEGSDAVVMLEDTQQAQEAEIEILKPAAVGENILQIGEDVKAGEQVLTRGTRLRPQEIGGLMALGVDKVRVTKQPRVGILSTGDEVVPPHAEPLPGQVRDINSYTLGSLIERAGGETNLRGIIPDHLDDLRAAAQRAHAEDDLVVITAGSSVSTRDITAIVIRELGEPGVLVHGVSIKPGKPTILAVCDGVPVIGLPGNPVSALVVAGLFVVPAIHKLIGWDEPARESCVSARMTANIASVAGREDYLPVRLVADAEGLHAEPVYGRSNLIFTLVRADGLVCIPPEVTGLAVGDEVVVRLF
jgi:molybdopterin molybdotransferase